MKRSLILLMSAGILLFSAASAEASLLRLSADPAVYIRRHPNPWLRWSWYTGPGEVTINVENKYKPKKDEYLNTIRNIHLVVSIRRRTKNLGLIMGLGDETFTGADFTRRGKHPQMPKHGVFGKNTFYFNYFLGTLAPSTSFKLDMYAQTPKDALVHLDAFGCHVYKKKCGKYKTKKIHNPFSKDVTYHASPEPASMGLLGMGLLGFAIRRKRKK